MRPAFLFTAATASYLANCALGTAVATRAVDTSDARWVHHALYVSTCALAALAGSSGLWGRKRALTRQSALLLLPAAVPLAVIPFLGSHSRRHPVVALSAAPFFVSSLIRSWR